MRWTILILNLLAVVALQFLAAYATAAHRTHSFSVYRELVANHALVEKPTYTNREPLDVERRLRTIGSGGTIRCSRISLRRLAWSPALCFPFHTHHVVMRTPPTDYELH